MVELTVPWETRCDEVYERKMAKYTELQEQCRRLVEVPVCFLWRMLGKLGIKAGDRKRTAGRLGQAAEKASNWL